MAYQSLNLATDTPPLVRLLITESVEKLNFSDVHSMLRLPLPEIGAGCNFAIAHVLLAVIGGVSATLCDSTVGDHGDKRSGEKFTRLLLEYYPWDSEPNEPKGTLAREGAACIIYDVFRNPLTHALGLMQEARGRKIAVKRFRIVTPGSDPLKNGLREEEIEQLEGARPREMSATVVKSATEIELFVEPLYWGVRHMIENLTSDKKKMEAAENFLKGRD